MQQQQGSSRRGGFHKLLGIVELLCISSGLQGIRVSELGIDDPVLLELLLDRLFVHGHYRYYYLEEENEKEGKGVMFDDGYLVATKRFEISGIVGRELDRVVIVAEKLLRFEYLGLDAHIGGLSAMYYCMLEYVGKGREQGVNKLKLAQDLGISAKDVFSMLKTLEKYNLITRKVQWVGNEKRPAYALIIMLKRFDCDKPPRLSNIKVKEFVQEDEIEEDFDEYLFPILNAIVNDAPENVISEADLRSQFEKQTLEHLYDWEVIRDSLFSTGKFRWIYRESVDFIKLITDSEEEPDLPCEVLKNPKSLDDGIELEEESSSLKTYLEIPNRALIFRTIMRAGTEGIHAHALTRNLGLPSKYVAKELRYLTSPAVGVTSVGSRVGKSFVYKLFGPGLSAVEPKNTGKTKRAKIETQSDPVIESQDLRSETELAKKRIRWIKDIVQSEKAILETHLLQIIRHREGSRSGKIARRSVRILSEKLSHEGALQVMIATINEPREKIIRIIISSDINIESSEARILAGKALRAPDPYKYATNDVAALSAEHLKSKKEFSEIDLLLCGYVPCLWIRLALLHLFLVRLICDFPAHYNSLSFEELVLRMPLHLFFQLCGVTDGVSMDTILEKDLHYTSIGLLPNQLRGVILDSLYHMYHRQCLTVVKGLLKLSSIGFLTIETPSHDMRTWSIILHSENPRFYLANNRLDSLESAFYMWQNLLSLARLNIDAPDPKFEELFSSEIAYRVHRKDSWRLIYNMSGNHENLIQRFIESNASISKKSFLKFCEDIHLRPNRGNIFYCYETFEFFRSTCISFQVLIPFKESKKFVKSPSKKKNKKSLKMPYVNLKMSISRRERPVRTIVNADQLFSAENDLHSNPEDIEESVTLPTLDDELGKPFEREFDRKVAEWNLPETLELLCDLYSLHKSKRDSAKQLIDDGQYSKLHHVVNILKMVMFQPEENYSAIFAFKLVNMYSDHEMLSVLRILKDCRLITTRAKVKGSRSLLFTPKVQQVFNPTDYELIFDESPYHISRFFQSDFYDEGIEANPTESEGSFVSATLSSLCLGFAHISYPSDMHDDTTFPLSLELAVPLKELNDLFVVESLNEKNNLLSYFSSFSLSEVHALVESFIANSEYGRTKLEIREFLRSMNCENPETVIHDLMSFERIFELFAFESIYYVAFQNRYIYSFEPLKNDNEADSSLLSCCEVSVTSWRLFDGNINFNLVQRLCRAIECKVLEHPGISEDDLVLEIAILSKPEVSAIINVLELDEKIQCRYMTLPVFGLFKSKTVRKSKRLFPGKALLI